MTKEIETLEEAVRELERRKREDPLKHVYKPHHFQEEGHQSRADMTLVVGGNRTGKTYLAVAESLLYCLGRSVYAEVPDPPNTVWYIVPTSDTFVDAVKPVLEKLMPQGELESVRGQKLKRYKFKNGSNLVIRSADQRQKRMVGAAVDFAVVDEPISKTVFEEVGARTIDTGGRILMVLTPVSEKQSEWLWIRDDLYIPHNLGERGDVDVIHMPVVGPDGEPAVPHLTKEQIEKFERLYPDPQVRAARMYGEFITRSGLVFSTFNPEVHLVDRFEIPPNWTRWLVCDPQYYRFAVLFFAADPDGNYYVTDEYFSQEEELAVRARRVRNILGEVDSGVPMYVDYQDQQDILELNHHFSRIGADIGAVPLPEQKRVEKMILRTHSMLEPDEDRKYHPRTGLRGVYGAPRILFFNDLESSWEYDGRRHRKSRLFWELGRLTWGTNDRPDKDSAGGADATDCLIYGCSVIQSGTVVEKPDEWKKRLPDRDVMLWEAIEAQDRLQDSGLQYPS